MLKTSQATQTILDLEDRAPDVLFETPPGMDGPLWPRVRMSFASALAQSELGVTAVGSPSTTWDIRKRFVKSLLPSRWDARGIRERSDVCFVTSGVTVHRTAAGERNWLIDDFAHAVGGQPPVLQWEPVPGRFGAPARGNTRSLDPGEARSSFRANRGRRIGPDPAPEITRLMAQYARLLGIDNTTRDELVGSALRHEAMRPFQSREIETILRRIRPRIVILDQASYGHRAPLVILMKSLGIHVVEPQHGWIGPSHGAYNFGAAMRHESMSASLPDELLTFGDFWSESIRHPAMVTTIGKPHLSAAVESAPPRSSRSKDVLVASSISDPEVTLGFIRRLARAMPEGGRVLFRPHPSERATLADRYGDLTSDPRIAVDANSDLYETLGSVRSVVGVASTVLFEARAFGCDVFVRDGSFLDYYAGDEFGPAVGDSDAAIDEIVAATTRPENDAASNDRYWAPAPLDRFTEWMTNRHGRTK